MSELAGKFIKTKSVKKEKLDLVSPAAGNDPVTKQYSIEKNIIYSSVAQVRLTNKVELSDKLQIGDFLYRYDEADVTSGDNGSTIIKTVDGKVYKKIYSDVDPLVIQQLPVSSPQKDFIETKLSYNTIADFRTKFDSNLDSVQITDKYKSGLFKYSAGSTAVDDGVIVLVKDNKRFIREYSGFFDAKWFDLKGDGSDETAKLQKAINTAATYKIPLYINELEIRCSNVDIKCDLKGNGILRSTSTTLSAPPTARIQTNNVIVEGITFDGNVSADPTTEEGWGSVYSTTGMTSTFTGASALHIGSGWNTETITLKDVTLRNSKDVNLRITGKNHKFINVKSYKARGVFGDCYYMDSAENLLFDNCTAKDFTRMGFVADMSSGKSCINVTFNACYAYYGHHSSAGYTPPGLQNFNSGFWAEGATEFKYINCVTERIWGTGFTYSTAGPINVLSTLTKNSVSYTNCSDIGYPEGYVRDNSGFDCRSYYQEVGKLSRAMFISYVNCKTEGKRAGFRINSKNYRDEINLVNCYVSYTNNHADYSFGYFIDPFNSSESGECLTVNMTNCSSNSFINSINSQLMGNISADISIVRNADNSSIGTGLPRRCTLNIDNFKKTEGLPVLKSNYGDYLDNVTIHNSKMYIGGYQDKLVAYDCELTFPDTSGATVVNFQQCTLHASNITSGVPTTTYHRIKTYSLTDCRIPINYNIYSAGGHGGTISRGIIDKMRLYGYSGLPSDGVSAVHSFNNVKFLGDINVGPSVFIFDGNGNCQYRFTDCLFASTSAPIDNTKFFIGNDNNTASISGSNNLYDSRVRYTTRINSNIFFTPNYFNPIDLSTSASPAGNSGLSVETSALNPEGIKYSMLGKLHVDIAKGDTYIKRTNHTLSTGWEKLTSEKTTTWIPGVPAQVTLFTGKSVKIGYQIAVSASFTVSAAGTYSINLPYKPLYSGSFMFDTDCKVIITANSNVMQLITTNSTSKSFGINLNFIEYHV